MDFLKRELAPLSAEAWEEIDGRAVDVLKTHLSGRKVVRVVGPNGWASNVVNEGRLTVLDREEGAVQTGIYEVRPLVETRIQFELDRWEMDNITRGASDANLDALDESMKSMALFEEQALYYGYDKGGISGLLPSAGHDPLPFGREDKGIMESLSRAIVMMQGAFQEGPFTLVVGDECWKRLHDQCTGYPLWKRAEEIIGGEIVYSQALNSAVLIPHDHDDLELTIGGDFSIGYVSHDAKKVRLFAAESFFFRVLDPAVIVPFSL